MLNKSDEYFEIIGVAESEYKKLKKFTTTVTDFYIRTANTAQYSSEKGFEFYHKLHSAKQYLSTYVYVFSTSQQNIERVIKFE